MKTQWLLLIWWSFGRWWRIFTFDSSSTLLFIVNDSITRCDDRKSEQQVPDWRVSALTSWLVKKIDDDLFDHNECERDSLSVRPEHSSHVLKNVVWYSSDFGVFSHMCCLLPVFFLSNIIMIVFLFHKKKTGTIKPLSTSFYFPHLSVCLVLCFFMIYSFIYFFHFSLKEVGESVTVSVSSNAVVVPVFELNASTVTPQFFPPWREWRESEWVSFLQENKRIVNLVVAVSSSFWSDEGISFLSIFLRCMISFILQLLRPVHL